MASEPVTIDVKVKTLSSQTHDFKVQNDLTVRQFKEHIADTVNVQPDLQRIIYRGRILNDAIQLKEYDMHGKVVHLVERPPPAPGSDNPDGPQVNATGPIPGVRHTPGSAFVYPGRRTANGQAGGVPGEGGPPSLNLSSTLCMNRITVARHMLTCAQNIVNHMDNPQVPLDNAPMDLLVQETLDTTVVGITASTSLDQVHDVLHAFRGAVNAALRPGGSDGGASDDAANSDLNSSTASSSSSFSLSFQDDGEPETMPRQETPPTAAAPNSPPVVASGESPAAAASTTPADGAAPAPTTTTAAADGDPSGTATNGDSNGRQTQQTTTSPRILAEVVDEMRNVQRRLEPHLQRYYDILSNEPTYTPEETTRREDDQRVYDRVSEALHYMSHAQHAISDLMLDLSATSPRHLCCRPILIEHSAFVNTGLPPPGAEILLAMGGNEIRMGLPSGAGAFQFSFPINGDGMPQPPSAAGAGNGAAAPATGTAPPSATATPAGGGATAQPRPRRVINATAAGLLPPHHQHVATIPILVQHTTNEMPTHMDPLQYQAAAAQAAAAALNRTGLQDLIQSIANAAPMATIELQRGNEPPITFQVPSMDEPMVQVSMSVSEPSQPASGRGAAGTTATNTTTNNNNGNSRTTSATTMPTTSTQTRSTARPQVHVTSIQQPSEMRGPRPFPTNAFNAFDRFLPCNSHHVRENNRHGASATGNGVAAGSGASAMGGVGGVAGPQLPENVLRMPQGRIQIPIGFPIGIRRRPASMAESNSRSASRDRQQGGAGGVGGAAAGAVGQTVGASRVQRQSASSSDDLDPVYNSPAVDEAFAQSARDELRSAVVKRFFNNREITVENIKEGVSEVVISLEDLLEPISRYEHPHICIRMSVLDVLRTHLQEMLNLLRQEGDDGDENSQAADARFGSNLIRSIRLFARRLTGILLQSDQRRQDIKQMFRTIFNRYLKDLPALPWGRILTYALKVCLETLDTKLGTIDTNMLTPHMVFKSPSSDEASPMEVEESDGDVGAVGGGSTTSQEVNMEAQPSSSGASLQNLSIRLRNESECEDYPEPAQAEPWHSLVPNGWVTTLASDLEEQKKITDSKAQPLSDAYLDGMTKKRRKTITDARPTGSVADTISSSVRQVIQNSGFQPTSPVDQIASQISSDVGLQSSYRESMNGSIRNRLRSDPNYDPLKYSNAEKYFK